MKCENGIREKRTSRFLVKDPSNKPKITTNIWKIYIIIDKVNTTFISEQSPEEALD
jgi:ribosomal protein L23